MIVSALAVLIFGGIFAALGLAMLIAAIIIVWHGADSKYNIIQKDVRTAFLAIPVALIIVIGCGWMHYDAFRTVVSLI